MGRSGVGRRLAGDRVPRGAVPGSERPVDPADEGRGAGVQLRRQGADRGQRVRVPRVRCQQGR